MSGHWLFMLKKFFFGFKKTKFFLNPNNLKDFLHFLIFIDNNNKISCDCNYPFLKTINTFILIFVNKKHSLFQRVFD